jgi:hypothetical protein
MEHYDMMDIACLSNRSFNSKNNLIEGSLEVKLPTIWTDEKQRWEESEKRSDQSLL